MIIMKVLPKRLRKQSLIKRKAGETTKLMGLVKTATSIWALQKFGTNFWVSSRTGWQKRLHSHSRLVELKIK
jgi:hypothetical protein